MQDRNQLTHGNSPSSTGATGASTADAPANTIPSPSAPADTEKPAASMLDQSLTALRDTVGEHKGKLAISAAALLGLMVYYKWGERSLAKEDPEEYERLRRIKNRVRHADEEGRHARHKDEAPSPMKDAQAWQD